LVNETKYQDKDKITVRSIRKNTKSSTNAQYNAWGEYQIVNEKWGKIVEGINTNNIIEDDEYISQDVSCLKKLWLKVIGKPKLQENLRDERKAVLFLTEIGIDVENPFHKNLLEELAKTSIGAPSDVFIEKLNDYGIGLLGIILIHWAICVCQELFDALQELTSQSIKKENEDLILSKIMLACLANSIRILKEETINFKCNEMNTVLGGLCELFRGTICHILKTCAVTQSLEKKIDLYLEEFCKYSKSNIKKIFNLRYNLHGKYVYVA